MVDAGDTFRLIIKGKFGLSLRVNDLAVQTLIADPTPVQQLELANDFKAVWQTTQNTAATWETWELRQLWGSGMTTVDTECRRDGGVVFGGPLSAPLNGTNPISETLPPQAAVVVTIVTGAIGRRKRGRWYGWGYSENDQNAGIWDSVMRTPLTTALTTFFNKYKSGGTSPAYQLGVWSERTASGCILSGTPPHLTNVDIPSPDTAFTPALTFTLRTIVYNQRRRTVNVGA